MYPYHIPEFDNLIFFTNYTDLRRYNQQAASLPPEERKVALLDSQFDSWVNSLEALLAVDPHITTRKEEVAAYKAIKEYINHTEYLDSLNLGQREYQTRTQSYWYGYAIRKYIKLAKEWTDKQYQKHRKVKVRASSPTRKYVPVAQLRQNLPYYYVRDVEENGITVAVLKDKRKVIPIDVTTDDCPYCNKRTTHLTSRPLHAIHQIAKAQMTKIDMSVDYYYTCLRCTPVMQLTNRKPAQVLDRELFRMKNHFRFIL